MRGKKYGPDLIQIRAISIAAFAVLQTIN